MYFFLVRWSLISKLAFEVENFDLSLQLRKGFLSSFIIIGLQVINLNFDSLLCFLQPPKIVIMFVMILQALFDSDFCRQDFGFAIKFVISMRLFDQETSCRIIKIFLSFQFALLENSAKSWNRYFPSLGVELSYVSYILLTVINEAIPTPSQIL